MTTSGTPEEGPVRVLLVDDSEEIIEIVGEMMQDHPDIELVGSAQSIADAIDAVESVRPRIVLRDSRLPDGTGAEGTRRIRSRWPDVTVLLFTSDASRQTLDAAAEAGAAGHVHKPEDLDRLADAVRRAAAAEVTEAPTWR
jgi:two-component system, NarL family, response regulator DevR